MGLTFSLGIFASFGLTDGGNKLEARGGDLGANTVARDGGLGDRDRGLFSLEDEGGSEGAGAGRLDMQTFTCFS